MWRKVNMIEGLEQLLAGSGERGLPELRASLDELFGGPDVTGRVIGQQLLKSHVYRLQFDRGRVRSVVVKRLGFARAQRNELVTKRWLPAIGLNGCCPG